MVGPDQAELEAAGWCIEKSAGWWTCYPPSGSMFEFLNVPRERKYCFGGKALQVIRDLMNDNPYVSIYVYQLSGTDPHERFIAWQCVGVNQMFSVPRTSSI